MNDIKLETREQLEELALLLIKRWGPTEAIRRAIIIGRNNPNGVQLISLVEEKGAKC